MIKTTPSHVRQNRYGDFLLTDAVRPGPGVPVPPREGYRLSRFRDAETQICLPVLGAAVSAERLFDVFLDLLAPLGERVHAVLETSHGSRGDRHLDLRRGDIDLPVLMSHFCDFEDLLLNDGCTGVAVVAAGRRIEVQLDEHKLLFVYARDLKPFRRILRRHGVRRDNEIVLIAEAAHLHHSAAHFEDEFHQLATRLGAADFDSVLSDESGFSEC
ncbi:MAG TPA: hypothetical protein VHR66_28530 [Gemmataceae bacterium]|nr:hypothetical protein [Gemmataceae bacterium]